MSAGVWTSSSCLLSTGCLLHEALQLRTCTLHRCSAELTGRPHAGVLTKLDIMDRGTDATAILHNAVIPLRLGHIGGDPTRLQASSLSCAAAVCLPAKADCSFQAQRADCTGLK